MSAIPISPGVPDLHQLAALVKQRARAMGFDLVGIADAAPTRYRDYWDHWLANALYGEMQYLARRAEERTDPGTYLSGARSVVCVAVNYHAPLDPVPEEQRHDHAKIARYALGRDYHEWIKTRLYDIADWLREQVPGAETRCSVDTAPVAERELAARAGIGWIGKNTCVINPWAGSWLLLAEVITTIELPPDQPEVDHCGSCTRCLDACPTGAIVAPYRLDPRRCISYLTIETGKPLGDAQRGQAGEWLYGCDICQDVCPWNAKAPAAIAPVLKPRFPTGTIDVNRVADGTDDELRALLRHSAIKRVKLPVLRENAKAVRQNLRERRGGPGHMEVHE